MPIERENRRERFDLYCVDPSDGHGKFSLVSPHRPGPRVLANDKRRSLCNMLLKVDGKAQPFRERLGLEVDVDENLVLTATAWSLNEKGKAVAEVHDLEFALATPGARNSWLNASLLGSDGDVSPHEPGNLSMRSNLAAREDASLVPGEVLYRYDPFYFPRRAETAAGSSRRAPVLRTVRDLRACVERPALPMRVSAGVAPAGKRQAERMTATFANRLSEALVKAAAGNSHAATAAAAVIWTDKERQWESSLTRLRASMPQLLTLGDFNLDTRSGPAVWLKCAIAGVLPEVQFKGVPVVYLPGVSRAELRAIESCPRDLQPLAELQYRGVFWSQVNTKDWTVSAFLSSKNGGLGLDVAQDKATQEALSQVLSAGVLLDRPLDELKGRQINSEWLLSLLAPNPTRDLLVSG